MQRSYTKNLYTAPNADQFMLFATTCNMVSNGDLIMGAGNALALRVFANRNGFDVAGEAGKMILKTHGMEGCTDRFVGSDYGLITYGPRKGFRCGLGLLQTKRNPWHPSDWGLLGFSLGKLKEYAEYHPHTRIACPMPGVGYGRLQESDVLPLLEVLPDNVHIFTKGVAPHGLQM